MEKKNILILFAVAIMLGLISLGARRFFNSEREAVAVSETTAAQTADANNPWTDCASKEEAEEVAAVNTNIGSILGADNVSYRAMYGLIEIIYSDGEGNELFRIRKGTERTDDISGDNNTYDVRNVAETGAVEKGENIYVSTLLRGTQTEVHVLNIRSNQHQYAFIAKSKTLTMEEAGQLVADIVAAEDKDSWGAGGVRPVY